MFYCKDCTHYQEVGTAYGDCNCNKFVYKGPGSHGPEIDELEYWDYEGYSAGFQVGAEFGCVHFELK